ncbi:MAG: isoprenylcysteine carboxylmethyltransferase family protein, partial [Candidatus Lokiarchaeota archaeon]
MKALKLKKLPNLMLIIVLKQLIHFQSLFGFFGLILFICSLVYQLLNRKKFICNGPYKYIRHPQYTGILIFTFCLTLISLNTSPIPLITENDYFPKSFLIYIWLMELSSYVFLAKIEEAWLKKKFGKLYDSYIKKTGFF